MLLKIWNAGKRAVAFVKDKALAVMGTAVAAGAASMVTVQQAHAELSEAAETALTTAFTGAVADATELQALVITPIIAILALGIVIKLIKRFGNKI